jgi:hypothetical protein
VGNPFEILITQQGWLAENDPDLDYDPALVDLCSHGGIRLTIGGQVIALGEDDYEYGISESALALLRTLESDHSPVRRVAERLIFHGCGTILMMGCPVGIDWSVSHVDGQVRIDDVVRYDTVNETEAVRFPGVAAELSEDEYRLQVVAFAEWAKEPFEKIAKEPADDFDQQQHADFWGEFDARLSRAVGKS